MRLDQIPQDHPNYLFHHLVDLEGFYTFRGLFCR